MATVIEYKDNLPALLKQLNRAGVRIQEAGAESVNMGAEYIDRKYKALLKTNLKRKSKFTLNATRIYKAHTTRSGGQLRKLRDINAVVGVRTMSGGKEHYLARMERGDDRTGGRQTGGKVPIPLRGARTGKNASRGISPAYRLNRNSVHKLNKRFRNAREYYGALSSMAKRGVIDGKKMYQTEFGIHTVRRGRVLQLRDTSQTRLEVKARPYFEEAQGFLTPRVMQQIFVITARRLIRQSDMV